MEIGKASSKLLEAYSVLDGDRLSRARNRVPSSVEETQKASFDTNSEAVACLEAIDRFPALRRTQVQVQRKAQSSLEVGKNVKEYPERENPWTCQSCRLEEKPLGARLGLSIGEWVIIFL